MRSLCIGVCLLGLVVAASACRGEQPAASSAAPTAPPPAAQPPTIAPPTIERIQATPEAVAKARADLTKLAEIHRKMRAVLTFDEFELLVYKEPFEGGKYIVDGDTTIVSRKQLREFFEKNVKARPPVASLVIATVDNLDAKWNQQQKTKLSYCVSNTFGSRHADVVQQMANATGEWEKVSAVDFIHDASQDGNCTPSNTAVVFDVRPVNVGEYLARAFFPNEPRAERNVLIDESSFELPADENLKLVGILRHELGHTLGFRHEHTRPESGACFEDSNWRPLTNYDAFSVMHYPQCNGQGDWSLILTPKDQNGSACVYGPASGFTIDKTQIGEGVTCATAPTPPPPGQPETKSFTAQSVAKDAQKAYGPFPVAPGSHFEATIGGASPTGDPDLYVRFGQAPTVSSYNCRPYLDGPVEACALTVPANATRVFVMVRGYAAGTYDLQVTHVPPAPDTLTRGTSQ
jgi:serine protease